MDNHNIPSVIDLTELFSISASLTKPLSVESYREDWVSATIWTLSKRGRNLWNESKNDVFVIDLDNVVYDELLHCLKKDATKDRDGWDKSDVMTGPRKEEFELGRLDEKNRKKVKETYISQEKCYYEQYDVKQM